MREDIPSRSILWKIESSGYPGKKTDLNPSGSNDECGAGREEGGVAGQSVARTNSLDAFRSMLFLFSSKIVVRFFSALISHPLVSKVSIRSLSSNYKKPRA